MSIHWLEAKLDKLYPEKMLVENMNDCHSNKYGFSKFSGKCRFLHEDTLCTTETSCDVWSCSQRHPRKCIHFKQYCRCKFDTY